MEILNINNDTGFTHSDLLKEVIIPYGDDQYEITVYKTNETDSHEFHLSKNGNGKYEITQLLSDDISDAKAQGDDLIDITIEIITSDIKEGKYSD